jgi:6-phospho-3-hexuloisomerase
MTFREASERILGETGAVLGQVDEEQIAALREAIRAAGAIFLTGDGRSGLVGRCLAMRLMQLGLNCHVLGETATPPIRAGDLLIAVSGAGRSEVTCARARAAARAGAKVIAVTACRAAPLAGAADSTLLIPTAADGRRSQTSTQHGGSLFEQCTLLAFDAIALQLQGELGQTSGQMDGRHATVG